MVNLVEKYQVMNKYEEQAKQKNFQKIAGIDEVGRGPLAGSLVVAGVILDKPIYGLDDSKKLTSKKIALLSQEIKEKADKYVIVEVRVTTIERLGIKKAVHFGMKKVIKKLDCDYALIDYEQVNTKVPSLAIIRGDSNSNSIAAASIIAKHFRDEKMKKIHLKYPNYGFNTHVGYGTKNHMEAIEKYGILEGIHRKNFKPISTMLGD